MTTGKQAGSRAIGKSAKPAAGKALKDSRPSEALSGTAVERSERKTAAGRKTAAEKTTFKKATGKKTIAKGSVVNKAAGKKTTAKKTTGRAGAAGKPETKGAGRSRRPSISLTAEEKDPRGGLTAAGRRHYNDATGGHLRPGIKHPAKTVEEKQRKGSFLRRHFANPPGPVLKDGKPTRQALQAAAWGEPVPRNEADERKLAQKGKKLLEEAKREK